MLELLFVVVAVGWDIIQNGGKYFRKTLRVIFTTTEIVNEEYEQRRKNK